MPQSNFERMIQLADEVFSYRTDPDQISVTEKEREKLEQISQATLSEYNEGDGPIAWIMLIPTTTKVMQDFITHMISERQLLEQTLPGEKYDAIYLCSALVLEEYRHKGIALKLTLDAIRTIQKDHEIKALYVWPFTDGGDKLADVTAERVGLPLFKRED